MSFLHYRCNFAKSEFTITEYEFLFLKKKVIYTIEFNAKTNSISENLSIDAVTVLKRSGNVGELRLGETVIIDNQLDAETLFLRTASFNTGRFPQEPVLHELMKYLHDSYCIDGYNQGAHWGDNITKYAEDHGIEKINNYLKNFNYDFLLNMVPIVKVRGYRYRLVQIKK